MQRPLILVFLSTLFYCCAAQNDTLPQCALLCAGTAATAAGCSSYYDTSCVCASQSFQAAIQSCFGGNCATTDQGTAWVYYSTLCTNNDSVSTGVSLKTTSVTRPPTTSSTPASTTATHTASGTITPTSSASSTTTSMNSSSTTTSSETPGATSSSEAVAVIDVHILHGIIGVIATVGVLML